MNQHINLGNNIVKSSSNYSENTADCIELAAISACQPHTSKQVHSNSPFYNENSSTLLPIYSRNDHVRKANSMGTYRVALKHQIKCVFKPTAVVCSDTAVFVGGTGITSSVLIWEISESVNIQNADLIYVGELSYMCSAVAKMRLNSSCTKLAVITQAGFVYIWDVHRSKFGQIRQQNELISQSANGFLPSASRISPLVSLHPKCTAECVAIDFIHDAYHTIVGVGKAPSEGINLYNGKTMKKICVIRNIYAKMKDTQTPNSIATKLNMYEFNCVATDTNRLVDNKQTINSSSPQNLTVSGRWVGAGDSCGNICAFFISDEFLNTINSSFTLYRKKKYDQIDEHTRKAALEYEPLKLDARNIPFMSLQICEKTVQVNDICWRFGIIEDNKRSMHLIAACSDGFVRFCGLEYTVQEQNGGSSDHDIRTCNGRKLGLQIKNMHTLKVCRGDCVGEVRTICTPLGNSRASIILVTCNSERKGNNLLIGLSRNGAWKVVGSREPEISEDDVDELRDDDIKDNFDGASSKKSDNNLFFDVKTIQMLGDEKDSVYLIGCHNDVIVGAAFSPKGKYAVSLSIDKCLLIYAKNKSKK